jgi:hypothetical protein
MSWWENRSNEMAKGTEAPEKILPMEEVSVTEGSKSETSGSLPSSLFYLLV